MDYFRFCYEYDDPAVKLDDGSIVAGRVRFFWADEFCSVGRTGLANLFLKPDSLSRIGALPRPAGFGWANGTAPAGLDLCHCCEFGQPYGVDFNSCWRLCLVVELSVFDGSSFYTEGLLLEWDPSNPPKYRIVSDTNGLPDALQINGVDFDVNGRPIIDLWKAGSHFRFLHVPYLGVPPPFEQDYVQSLGLNADLPEYVLSSWSVSGVVCP